MTLDLGFAPLRFPDGVEAGIVDVPGHERFLHNMLAGAAGMELILLVIAANEGPKPQTREHLQILNLLNAQHAIIVLSKADLVQGDERIAATELARAACSGTFAAGAPLIAVSTVTGEGLEELKTAIHDTLAALPPQRTDAPAFMPVDRVFALPGHGTIVTGTLMQGTIHTGDTLVLAPSGLPARIKSLQTFGAKRAVAYGGARVAVNLPGVEVGQIARGEALVAARHFEPQTELALWFTPLAEALPLFRKRTPVRAHIGSAEIPGILRFTQGVPTEASDVAAQLTLSRPTVAYSGMRLVLRRLSPKDLLGGAVVQGVTVSTDASANSDSTGPKGVTEINAVLQAANLQPLSLEKLATQTNTLIENASAALDWLIENGHAAMIQKPAEYLSLQAFNDAWLRTQALLRRQHENAPWKVGITAADLAKALALLEHLMLRLLNAWQEDGRVISRAGRWHAPDFSPSLTKAQLAFFENALAFDATNALLPHSYAALAQAAERARDLSESLDSLLAVGALVRIGDDVYRRKQIDQAKERVAAAVAQNGTATMAQVRDALGTSRKYALPLMEYFDSSGFTIRDGDRRRLRGK